MENIPSDIRPLSAPSSYRQTVPAVLPLPPVTDKMRQRRRQRLFIGFAVTLALHAAAILAWRLAPPLRLKAAYSPERWVHLLHLPERGDPAVVPPPR